MTFNIGKTKKKERGKYREGKRKHDKIKQPPPIAENSQKLCESEWGSDACLFHLKRGLLPITIYFNGQG